MNKAIFVFALALMTGCGGDNLPTTPTVTMTDSIGSPASPASIVGRNLTLTTTATGGITTVRFQSEARVVLTSQGGPFTVADAWTYERIDAQTARIHLEFDDPPVTMDFDLMFESGSHGTWAGVIRTNGEPNHAKGTFTLS